MFRSHMTRCHSRNTTQLAVLCIPRSQILCYDHDVLSGPDLIGRVKLGTDAILAMVNTLTMGHDAVDGIGGQAAGVSTTWLELEPGGGNNENTPAMKARNPFESLGDIAVALTAKRALPSSLEEYRWAKQEERSASWSRSIADASVLVRERSTVCCCEQCAMLSTHYCEILFEILSMQFGWRCRVINYTTGRGGGNACATCVRTPGAEVNATCRNAAEGSEKIVKFSSQEVHSQSTTQWSDTISPPPLSMHNRDCTNYVFHAGFDAGSPSITVLP